MGKSILVVEDEGIIAEDIKQTLTKLGYAVLKTASSGENAIRYAQELQPDLVLMDIKLKGEMDGIEAARVIRGPLPGTDRVPHVALRRSDASRAQRETQPYGYLLKPFDDRELRTAIEVALRKHELERELADRERWFSTTLRSIGDAVIAVDERQRVTFINPSPRKSPAFSGRTPWGVRSSMSFVSWTRRE